jgi:hypothetical protein
MLMVNLEEFQMVQWEYQVIEAPQSGVPAGQLNDSFGKEGWQLTGIIPKDKDGTGYYFYFCRPRADEPAETVEAAEAASPPPGFGSVDTDKEEE